MKDEEALHRKTRYIPKKRNKSLGFENDHSSRYL